MIAAVWRDVRYGARMLGRQPAFTAVAVISLALGIGLNSAIFTIVNAVLLRPLPIDRPDRLVALFTSADSGDAYSSSSYPDYADLASNNSTLDGLAAHTLMFVGIDRGDATRTTLGEIVSPNYFAVLGVPLVMGPGFRAGDDRPGAEPTTVISSRMWQRDFNRAQDVVGRTIQIRGRSYAIVGVAPASFGGLAPGVSSDLWLPAGSVDDVEPVGMIDTSPSPTGSNRIERRGQRWLFLTGRLKPGVTTAQARADLSRVMTDLERAYPQSNKNRRLTVVPANDVRIHPDLDSALTPGAAAMMIAVGLVLLVACANLASLLLARGTARSREMAIRLAIGASRPQLVRQLIAESLLLAWAGAAAGLALATWATRALSAIQPPIEVRVGFDFSPDARVLGFTIGIATLTGLAFGLLPALRASRPDLVPSLKGEAGAGRAQRFDLRRWLVAAEIALSTVLLVTGGLLLRSTLAAVHADTGVNASRVVYASVNGTKMYADRARALQFYGDAARRLESIPGVLAVTRASWVPLSLNHNTTVIDVDGVRGPAPDGGINVDTTDVSVDYFRVIGVPIVSGRAFDSRDNATGSRVAIVSAAAARACWPGQSPLGRQFRERNGGTFTVVGVSADYAVRAIGETPRPLMHFAIDQTQPSYQIFAVSTDRPAADLMPPVRQAIVAVEPRAIFVELQPLSNLVDTVLFPVRASATLLAGLSALALLLATIGLYGVIAFNVSRRTREIGLRMALGASQGRVVRQVVADGLLLVALGGLIGAAGAAVVGRLLASALYGTTAFDPLAWVAALAALSVAAAAAAFIPARRAAAVDPMRALRQL